MNNSSSQENPYSYTAWKIFTAFLEDSQLSLGEDELLEFAKKELRLNVTRVPTEALEFVPSILVAYANIWPEWQHKHEWPLKFSKQYYFSEFCRYLIGKINQLNDGEMLKSALEQSELISSSCAIAIHCPPSMLNTLMFVNSGGFKAVFTSNTSVRKRQIAVSLLDSISLIPNHVTLVLELKEADFECWFFTLFYKDTTGDIFDVKFWESSCKRIMYNWLHQALYLITEILDDIILKQHLGTHWRDLSTVELVNWPYVEVTFYTPDLCFIRRQATEFKRYLTYSQHTVDDIKTPVIENMQNLWNGRAKACYSYRLLEAYIKEYILALKTIKDITGGKLEEIHTILAQFLDDVKCINVNNSMVTNIAVLFNLTPAPFFRYKKSFPKSNAQSEDSRVGFCEVITPKIELAMLHFRPKQTDTPYLSFELPERIKKTDSPNMLPQITYKCTFCKLDYDTANSKALMMDHLRQEHKMELHVRCVLCQEQMEVSSLAIKRWKHTCETAVSSTQETIVLD